MWIISLTFATTYVMNHDIINNSSKYFVLTLKVYMVKDFIGTVKMLSPGRFLKSCNYKT